MAINLTDFTNAYKTDQFSGIKDLLPNILAGYKTAKEPAAMDLEERKQQFINTILGSQAQYSDQQQQADISLKMAQAIKARQEAQNPGGQSLTPRQKELRDLYGDGPEYQAALKRQYGIIDGADVPAGSVPLDTLSPGERNEATKRMRTELTKANDLTKAHKTLEAMDKIMDAHPNMADYFSTALVDPSAKKTMLGQLKRLGVSKKDLAAVEEFTKLSNDLVLSAGQSMGNKAFTDAKLKVIEQAKPNANNTYEANKFVIDYMKNDFEPYVAYGKAIQHGLKNRYEVLEDPESYRGKNSGDNMQNFGANIQKAQQSQPMQQAPQQGVGQTIPMFKNGKRYSIPADKVNQALQSGFTNE